jgi:hypothetical protein
MFNEAKSEFDVDARDAQLQEAAALACEEAATVNIIRLKNVWGASENLVWDPQFDSKSIPQYKSMSLSD